MKFLYKSAEAARLLAEDRLTDQEIADQVGISRSTLHNWKQDEDFQRRVNGLVNERMRRAFTTGLARKERRLEDLAALNQKLWQVIDARKNDPQLSKMTGGTTGLMVVSFKGLGFGEDFRIIPVVELDTGLITKIMDVHERVAEELGQKIKRHSLMGPDGEALNFGPTTVTNNVSIGIDLELLTNEQLRQLRAIYRDYIAKHQVVDATSADVEARDPASGQDRQLTGQP